MGFYAKHVLPHLIDLAMRNKDTTRLPAEWVPQAGGDVLEIGIHLRRNLPFYSSHVKHIFGVVANGRLSIRHAPNEQAQFSSSAERMTPMLPVGDVPTTGGYEVQEKASVRCGSTGWSIMGG